MKKIIQVAMFVLIASTASPLLANIPAEMKVPVSEYAIDKVSPMNNAPGNNDVMKPERKHELKKMMNTLHPHAKADSSVLIVISSTALLIIIILLLIIIF